ncbi:MAG: outer membrane beta-barrel protein [Candidatus Aminicenantes bacterium]|nr:outer membrane beta-barrel protein [Candidatus Aminicenantes bacterium]
MKRYIILFLVVMTVIPLYGEFKILAGIDFSRYQLYQDDAEDIWGHTRWGLTGGIGFEHRIFDFLWLEFDLTVIQKGSRLESEEGDVFYRYQAASAPFLLKWKPFFHTSPYLLGGAEIQYGLSHKRNLKQDETEDIKSSTNLFGWGIAVGAGLEWKFKEHLFLFLEIRYSNGMSNLEGGFLNIKALKSRTLIFYMGIKS